MFYTHLYLIHENKTQRDWLLEKLRKTKKYFNKLDRKWSKLTLEEKDDGSESVFTADSALSIGLETRRSQSKGNSASMPALQSRGQTTSPGRQSAPLLETYYPNEDDDLEAGRYDQEDFAEGSVYTKDEQAYYDDMNGFTVYPIIRKEKRVVGKLENCIHLRHLYPYVHALFHV